MDKKVSKSTQVYFGWLHITDVPCEIHPKHGEILSAKTLAAVEACVVRALVTLPAVIRGEEFLFLRKFFAMSRAALAEKFGVTENTILAWEKLERPLDTAYQAYARIVFSGQLRQYLLAKEETLVSKESSQAVVCIPWSADCADLVSRARA